MDDNLFSTKVRQVILKSIIINIIFKLLKKKKEE